MRFLTVMFESTQECTQDCILYRNLLVMNCEMFPVNMPNSNISIYAPNQLIRRKMNLYKTKSRVL
jgi:hypothetical protein